MEKKTENIILKCAYGVIGVALLIVLCMIIPKSSGESDNEISTESTHSWSDDEEQDVVTVEIDPYE